MTRPGAGRAPGQVGGAGAAPGWTERGQVLVVFALSIVLLFAAAGLAFDVGRFYSERRFLQNAADAAALAAANALIRGESVANAEVEARQVLSRNFLGTPNGITPALPPATPVYESGHAGDPLYLLDGILINGGDIRVAIRNSVGYTFGRVVGLGDNAIGARARVNLTGDLLPIAVRHYVSPPGPKAGAAAPCPDDQTQFMDFFATADTACLGTESNAALRTAPTAGAPFDFTTPESDPANHGPVVAILGQGAQSNSPADFRGFIALDVRNFATATSQSYYNGVTAGTNANTLKLMEANWVLAGGYPGPMFPPVTNPPSADLQVAVMSGNSTGAAIDAMPQRYAVGDPILVTVYSGAVNAVPDFALVQPAPLALPTTGTVANAGTLKVSRNDSFTGLVTLSTLADTADPTNPMVLGTLLGGGTPITYSPNPVTPATGNGTNVSMSDVSTLAAADGIYVVWIQGVAGSPYLTTKVVPMQLTVGSVTKDFTFTSDVAAQTATGTGSSVAFNLTLQNAPNRNTNFGGPVDLSVDGPLPAGIGSVTFGSSSVTPSRNGASTTLTINTGTMAPGRYTFVVRAKGTNTDPTPRPVTHVQQLTVDVPPILTGNSGVYIDIVGFAVMRIVSMDSNTVSAYAITPVATDMNDPVLRRGQVARLTPWQ